MINIIMRVTNKKIGGQIIKDNSVYLLEDNQALSNLVLSKTTLHVGQETTGHFHSGVEEIYFFQSGQGRMTVGNNDYQVVGGDIILIPDGDFHKVFNLGTDDLIFICVFQTYTR